MKWEREKVDQHRKEGFISYPGGWINRTDLNELDLIKTNEAYSSEFGRSEYSDIEWSIESIKVVLAEVIFPSFFEQFKSGTRIGQRAILLGGIGTGRDCLLLSVLLKDKKEIIAYDLQGGMISSAEGNITWRRLIFLAQTLSNLGFFSETIVGLVKAQEEKEKMGTISLRKSSSKKDKVSKFATERISNLSKRIENLSHSIILSHEKGHLRKINLFLADHLTISLEEEIDCSFDVATFQHISKSTLDQAIAQKLALLSIGGVAYLNLRYDDTGIFDSTTGQMLGRVYYDDELGQAEDGSPLRRFYHTHTDSELVALSGRITTNTLQLPPDQSDLAVELLGKQFELARPQKLAIHPTSPQKPPFVSFIIRRVA